MTHASLALDVFDQSYLLTAPLTVGIIQGVILYSRQKQFFFSWVVATTAGTILAVYIGLIVSAAAFFFLLLGAMVGCATGGALLGCAQSLALRKFPRAKVLIPIDALALCVILLPLILLSWQSGDMYTASPAHAQWVLAAAIGGAIAGTLQAIGLLYVLTNTQLPSPYRYRESELLAKRPLVDPALYEPAGKAAFYAFWVGGTLLALKLSIDLYAADRRFAGLAFVAVGIAQGLAIARWFRRFKLWMLLTSIGNLLGYLLGTVLSLPISFFVGEEVLALFVGFAIGGVVIGYLQSFALRGFPRAKRIVLVDLIAIGIVLPSAILLASSEPPLSSAPWPIANWGSVVVGTAAVAIQGAGVLHVLNRSI